MRENYFNHLRTSAGKATAKHRITRMRRTIVIGMLACAISLVLAVQAYNRLVCGRSLKPTLAAQGGPRLRSRLHSRLSLQPEADRMRRRLGQRFQAAGREVSVVTGMLAIGNERHVVSIARTQDDDDERVAIAVDSGPASLNWSGKDGATAAARPAGGVERSLIERIALDSPDQFVLAQLRGASYFTVAQNARPKEAAGQEDYAGPVWDLIRVGEPEGSGRNSPHSKWRLYYINTSTGLIDKVMSQEGDEIVLAEISAWKEQSQENAPARITWRINGRVVMEMNINLVAYSARQ